MTVATERPPVLIIGGFLSSPPLYRPLRDRLLARGAASVAIAPIWLPDWLLGGWRGHGPIATRAGRALLAASRAAGGTPLLVVGHSAGGVLARILTAQAPFDGRRFAGSSRIGAIVTLGSPHVNTSETWMFRRTRVHPAGFAEAEVPGAFFSPGIGYLSVASRRTTARAGTGPPAERLVRLRYERVLPPPWPEAIDGDGLIPVSCALLPGSRRIVLDDAAHGQGSRHPWYGSEAWVDTWWPAAVEVWREALDARAAANHPPGSAR